MQHYVNTPFGGLVDEDYRLGRTILDEFRTNVALTQVGTQITPVAITPIVTTPIVSTPGLAPAVAVPNNGANALQAFL